jgi:hypothetical protein
MYKSEQNLGFIAYNTEGKNCLQSVLTEVAANLNIRLQKLVLPAKI